jgi:hypothetical protein
MSKMTNLEIDAVINEDLRAHGVSDYRIFEPGERVRTLKAYNEAMIGDYVPANSTGKFHSTELIGDTVVLRVEMDQAFNGPNGQANVLEFYLEIHEDVSDYIA